MNTHWRNDLRRRRFLAGLGITSALPFLEGALGRRTVHAQPARRLRRLVIVTQAHMSLGYHRVPDLATGPYGAGDASRLRVNPMIGARVGEFGREPGKLGGFYEVGALRSDPRLQDEMMVVNGVCGAYAGAQGHQSDGNGSWSGGGQSGRLNTRSRFPLSGSLHQPMVTIDHVIARKIHTNGQRSMFMGDANWGGGGAATDESVDYNGAIQGLARSTNDLFNGPVFDGGRKITTAQQRLGGGGSSPPMPADPRAALSVDDFAILAALEQTQRERVRLLADGRLSGADRQVLEQYYDFLNEGLRSAQQSLMRQTSMMSGSAPMVSSECRAPTVGGGDMGAFLRLVGAAFLCDLSRIALFSIGSYKDHNTVWHAGADGNPAHIPVFNIQAQQMIQAAQFLQGLRDPETGRDMLESTLVLGVTNCSMAVRDGRDPSHSYGDFSYFSIGGSAALNTGKMYDFLGGTRRQPVSGPVPTVNQYLQTIAAAFGLTATDWSPANGRGFGPWLSGTWSGRPLRVSDADKTSPIPGLLKSA